MAVHFYLTTNIIRDEPPAIKAVSYVHVKAYSDGNRTICITEEPVVDPNLTELNQADAQTMLNSWIDEEIANGVPNDRINLDVFLD